MTGEKPKFGWTDAVIIATLVAVVGFLLHEVGKDYVYNWRWANVPRYFAFKTNTGWHAGKLTLGLLTTIRLSVIATVLAVILGLFMGLNRLSKGLFGKLLGGSYVETVRNVPPLVLVFIAYHFVGRLVPGLESLEQWVDSRSPVLRAVLTGLFGPADRLANFIPAVLTLGLYEGAYVTEIVRAGVQAVDRGQWDACHALGLSRFHELRYVILPQALRNVLPALSGQFISAIKDSAIVSLIDVQELTFAGKEVADSTRMGMEMWLTVAAVYLALTLSCSVALSRLEKKLARSHA